MASFQRISNTFLCFVRFSVCRLAKYVALAKTSFQSLLNYLRHLGFFSKTPTDLSCLTFYFCCGELFAVNCSCSELLCAELPLRWIEPGVNCLRWIFRGELPVNPMWQVFTRPTSASVFYLPHMEYEGSIGFVMRKMKKNYCWFSRFRTSYG
jgi:hypothetical protein